MLLVPVREVLNGVVKFSFLYRPTPLLFPPFSAGSPAALQSFIFPFSWKRIAWLLYDSHFTARDNSGRLRACLIERVCVHHFSIPGGACQNTLSEKKWNIINKHKQKCPFANNIFLVIGKIIVYKSFGKNLCFLIKEKNKLLDIDTFLSVFCWKWIKKGKRKKKTRWFWFCVNFMSLKG